MHPVSWRWKWRPRNEGHLSWSHVGRHGRRRSGPARVVKAVGWRREHVRRWRYGSPVDLAIRASLRWPRNPRWRAFVAVMLAIVDDKFHAFGFDRHGIRSFRYSVRAIGIGKVSLLLL